MKFNENMASLHAYLSGDGYVIRNPPEQKHKYYRIDLRNFNSVLLKDFQNKFYKEFGVKPKICADGRCRKKSKEIYLYLTKEYSYYSYEWEIPKFKNKTYLSSWIRSFYDCEGWVINKERQSRCVNIESVNFNGLKQLKKYLLIFNIKTAKIKSRKQGKIFRLEIFGKENLIRFQNKINFIHPEKKTYLEKAINSYVNYFWTIPKNKKALLKFIKKIGIIRKERKHMRINSIKKKNLAVIKIRLMNFKIKSKLGGPYISGSYSKYYTLTMTSSQS